MHQAHAGHGDLGLERHGAASSPATTGTPDGSSQRGICHPRQHWWEQPPAAGVCGHPLCPVYPMAAVSSPGTALGEAALALGPWSTREGCSVTATSRLLKCRCSAMVDVINNAISDLFFPV